MGAGTASEKGARAGSWSQDGGGKVDGGSIAHDSGGKDAAEGVGRSVGKEVSEGDGARSTEQGAGVGVGHMDEDPSSRGNDLLKAKMRASILAHKSFDSVSQLFLQQD